MDDHAVEKARNVAMEAAREAGGILIDNFGKPFWVKEKSPGDALTEIDLKAEKAILERIKNAFPDHAILAEESGMNELKNDYMWVVDPLDGTTNFSLNNPFFGTSISLTFKLETVMGVTFVPMTGELFSAIKGQGAYLDSMRTGKRVKLSVSPEKDISKLLLSFCNGKEPGDREEIARIFSALKPIARDFDRYKAGALEIAFTAAGRFGGYMANSQMSWDSSSGALLVREAGGRVTDFSGNDWDVNSPDILATNGHVHEQLLSIIKENKKS